MAVLTTSDFAEGALLAKTKLRYAHLPETRTAHRARLQLVPGAPARLCLPWRRLGSAAKSGEARGRRDRKSVV